MTSAFEDARQSLSLVTERPALIVVELVWRWAFAIGAIGILLAYSVDLRDAISLSAADQGVLLSGDLSQTIAVASGVAFGAMPFLISILIGAVPIIAAIWWISATIGRGHVLRQAMRLTGRPPAPLTWRYWLGMAIVHAVRALTLLIVVIAWAAGGRLSALVMGDPSSPNIIAMVVVFLIAFAAGSLLWAFAHFIASQATMFVAAGEGNGFHAITLAVRLSVEKMSAFWNAAAINAAWRTAVATLATMFGVLLIPISKFAPSIITIALGTLLTVAYCAVSDVLLLARTVAYLRIAFGSSIGEVTENTHQSALYSAAPDLRK